MRLGQLARKLAISPTEIIKFVESNGIAASEGSNTRLMDEHIRLVLQQFDPAGTVSLAAEQTDDAETAAAAPVVEPPAALVVEAQTEPVAEAQPELALEVQMESVAVVTAGAEESPGAEAGAVSPEESPLPDVIKAPKVALAGLKVVGKIELPEPKKKEQPAAPENTALPAEATAQPERRPRPDGSRGDRREGREGGNRDGKRSNRNDTRRGDKPRKNPVALQREREAQEAQLKKEAQAKAEKERRTQYYYNRVKASVPTKPARIIREQTVEMADEQSSTPTSWLGKFWKWFRS
jgi:hypothetical protein